MSKDFLKFLLVCSWANDGDAIYAWKLLLLQAKAIAKASRALPCAIATHSERLLSPTTQQAPLTSSGRASKILPLIVPIGFASALASRLFLCMECTNEAEALDAAWERSHLRFVSLAFYDPLTLRLTPAEKLSLRSQEGILPKWVKTADAYVLWAINGINESAVCTSKRIIKHPANAGLYVQSTVYNTLASLREAGLVAERWIEIV
jgi:hypothetical protein